jgi:hypothetical protein
LPEPVFGRHPVEYFGHAYTDHSENAKNDQSNQHCPFLNSQCKKPRKSQPDIKVGVCSVGYKAEFIDKYLPVVICPCRYNVQDVFNQIASHYLSVDVNSQIRWASEVSIGSGGSIDYVITKSKNASPTQIDDFICIEFQAAGTTGTPWEAVKEFQVSRAFANHSYKFGINWANEFAKTMMQQVYKKGMIIESWKKRIVFVLQDVGMEYLCKSYDVSGLRDPARDEDPIQFFSLRMDWDDTKMAWLPVPSNIVSTDLEGIRKILAGSAANEYITLDRFVDNIKRRLR